MQQKMTINENNELVLIESRTMRDEYVFKDSVLDKIKEVPLLPNSFESTVELAANFYEVPTDTIKTIIKRQRSEFNEYEEIRVLKGKALKDFKGQVHGEPDLQFAPSITLITRRGLLRIGMLLTESEIAKSVRNYLLNVEEITPQEVKNWAVEREISKRERRQLTDAIQQFYTGSLKEQFKYSTFTDLVYKVLFDTNTTGLKKLYDLEKNDSVRDSLSNEDLRAVVLVEKTIASLLLLGKGYGEIKEELFKHQERFSA